MKKALLLCIGVFVSIFSQAQTPADPQSESILIIGATAHLGTGEKIEDSAIGFEDGVLTFVGARMQVQQQDWDQVIDAAGKHVYPGFITPNSTLG